MHQSTRSAGATIAVILLGVAAAGTASFGPFAPVIALRAADLLGGSPGSPARAAMVVVGIISLMFAAAAAVAARMVRTGRPAGAMIGFVLGVILVASPAVASAPADRIRPCSPPSRWARASSARWRSPLRRSLGPRRGSA